MERHVEFPSQGAILRGRLFLPVGVENPPPIVVMAHGYSATATGMVADRYAEAFCRAGVAVLLYDHYGFGRSGGEPRQQIDHWLQVIGYRDAIDFVGAMPGIDGSRRALWGDSMSGACALAAAGMDRRVGAIVAQVPALGGSPPPADPDGVIFGAMAETYARPQLGPATGPTDGPMPVVSADQLRNASALTPLTAYRWFIEYGGRYGTEWQNWVTTASRDGEPYHPGLCAARVRAPALFVIASHDEMPGAGSDVARSVFDQLPGPKELVELDGGHFGLLQHPGALFDQASSAECDFLVRCLAASR
jgi:dienelactone hydrolase